MKKLGIITACVLVIALGVGTWHLQRSDAQEAVVITAHVADTRIGGDKNAGDECRITASNDESDAFDVNNVIERLVVAGPDGTILAAVPLEGTVEVREDGVRDCVVHVSASVPDVSFYTLSIGDQHIVTVAREDLPFGDLWLPYISVND